MSNDRVLADIKRDHIRTLESLFKFEGGKWVAKPEAFFANPQVPIDLGNLIGAMHKSELEQYPPAGTPPPPPADPLARLIARGQTFGEWAAWFLMQPDEETVARERFGYDKVSLLNNFYQGGGGGGLRVNGKMGADGVPFFYRADDGETIRHPDVNGAADAYVLEMAKAQGITVEASPIKRKV